MTQWNIDRGKKVTGGKINLNRKKKKFQRGSSPLYTTIGPFKQKIDRRRAGLKKVRLLSSDFVNALNPKTKKTKRVKIIDVVDHADNPHYTRRRIITKGCVVKTEIGLVKITSRPSQQGIVNGLIIDRSEGKS